MITQTMPLFQRPYYYPHYHDFHFKSGYNELSVVRINVHGPKGVRAIKEASENDQEIPQSHTTDKPTVP